MPLDCSGKKIKHFPPPWNSIASYLGLFLFLWAMGLTFQSLCVYCRWQLYNSKLIYTAHKCRGEKKLYKKQTWDISPFILIVNSDQKMQAVWNFNLWFKICSIKKYSTYYRHCLDPTSFHRSFCVNVLRDINLFLAVTTRFSDIFWQNDVYQGCKTTLEETLHWCLTGDYSEIYQSWDWTYGRTLSFVIQ